MRIKLQLVICDDNGHEETVTDVVTLRKDHRELGTGFKRWYPDMEVEDLPEAT